MRYERERQEAQAAALDKAEFERREKAFMARSAVELFEMKQALADGAGEEEARPARRRTSRLQAFSHHLPPTAACVARAAARRQRRRRLMLSMHARP